MTTATQIANCPEAQRAGWLKKAFLLNEKAFGAVLFGYLVADYKRSVNKRKAIFIYDECIFDNMSHFDLRDTLDLHSLSEFARPTSALGATISHAKTLIASTKGMSWFQRVSSSGERKMSSLGAGGNLFDEILAQHLDEDGKDNVWKDITVNGRIDASTAPTVMDIYKSMKKQVKPTIDALKAAEFNTAKIGMDGMAKTLP